MGQSARNKSRCLHKTIHILLVTSRRLVFLSDLQYLFLVGGFAESPMLQHEIRREFGQLLTVLIPHDVSLAVLRGEESFFLISAKF